MSTAYFVWPFLYFLFPLSSLAGPLYTASLPTSVIASIPWCAQSCVKNFVAREFSSSACRLRQDLDCFCASDSTSGFTLGEGAYLCLLSNCSDPDLNEELVVHEICQNIRGAKPLTHSTITTTQILTTDPFSSTSTHTISKRTPSSSSFRISNTIYPMASATSQTTPKSTSTTNEILSSTPSSKRSTLPTPSSSTLPSIPATLATSSATAPPSSSAATAAAAKPALAKSQVAGIAVGGVACVAIALGLLFFVFCIRPRRSSRKRLSGSSFGNDKIIASNPVSPGFFPTGNEDPERIQGVSPQSIPTSNAHSEQARLMAFSQVARQSGFVTPERKNASESTLGSRSLHPEEIGLAVGSETRERPAVDGTPASHRTTSKLLPDKPSYSLYPSPLRIQNPRSPVSPISGPLPGEAGIGQKGPMPLLRPSPRLGNSPDSSQLQLPRGFPPMHASASDPFLDSHSGPQALTYTSPRRQRLRLETPSSNRPDPEIMKHEQWTQALNDLRKPVSARHSSSARELNRQKAAYASISPNEYTGRPLFQPLVDRPSHVRQEGQGTKRGNRSGPPMPRYSSASDTNFEDTDDEEEIPPMPTSYHFLPPIRSSGDVAHSKIRGSAVPQQFGQRPPPTSPTPKPARRNQPLSAPLSIQKLSGSKGMQNTKPLPRVPEVPDTPVISTAQGRREKPPPIAIHSRRTTDDIRKTAKWKILVSPGLDAIENSSTPQSQGSSAGRPTTPPKQLAARIPVKPSRRY